MTWKHPSQISGNNGTIDGQGEMWWELWWNRTLNHTRGHLVELANSTNILISNITLRNSPFWTVHPVYSRSVYHVVSTFFLHFLTQNASSFFTLLKPSTEQENVFFFFFIYQQRGDEGFDHTGSPKCSKHRWHWSRFVLLLSSHFPTTFSLLIIGSSKMQLYLIVFYTFGILSSWNFHIRMMTLPISIDRFELRSLYWGLLYWKQRWSSSCQKWLGSVWDLCWQTKYKHCHPEGFRHNSNVLRCRFWKRDVRRHI